MGVRFQAKECPDVGYDLVHVYGYRDPSWADLPGKVREF
jgi:hypothetical protein